MKNPNQLLNEILYCFGNQKPTTIILGGSYSTNESGNLTIENKIYALSDFDLLCINEIEYSTKQKFEIYKNMLALSNSINQSNPYFHIGLKIRTPSELKNDVNSLYFKELSLKGKVLIGKQFSHYFEKDEVFGFEYLNDTMLYDKLYYCGLTRLWCNILFFPIKSLTESQNKQWNLWYSYFFSRGVMDWITFELIEKNKWSPTYTERFNIWCNEFATLDLIKAFQLCFNMKLGKQYIDYRTVFNSILSFSLLRLNSYAFKSSIDTNNSEFKFIISMLKFINIYVLTNECDNQLLNDAKIHLEKLINKNISYIQDNWDLWHSLRCIYSDYRFYRSNTDRTDHYIYTNYFLKIGAK
jgi:hypothetical protein